MKNYVKRFVSFILAVGLILSMSACAVQENDNLPVQEEEKQEVMKVDPKNDNIPIIETATQLFKAEYPEMVQYPIQEDYSYSYDDYEAWMQCRNARQPETQSIRVVSVNSMKLPCRSF